ncbi:MAG TPA: hypothetical protein VM364_05645 [Vicinamibacterales bacterium]|nr:hypothetical protein [Vicinamibacterales bacterium]
MQMFTSRMMRDVAIWLMDDTDRYRLAKDILERAVEYRAYDPKALWALGRAYKLVGQNRRGSCQSARR